MSRGQMVLALGLALALIWAYLLTHPPGGGTPAGRENIVLWDLPEQGISHLIYQDGEKRLTLRPDWSQGGEAPYVWVESLEPPSGQARPGEPPPALRPVAFRGNPTTHSIVTFFAGARARRSIGPLSGLDGAEFGIPSERHFVEVHRTDSGTPLRLEVGRTLYGNSGLYVYAPGDGAVYLMDIRNFQILSRGARSLMDPRLLSIRPESAARVEIRQGVGKPVILIRREDGRWGAEPDGSRSIEAAAGFLGGLAGLRVTEYLTDDPAPPAASVTYLLQVKFYGPSAGSVLEDVRFYPGEGPAVKARSFHTRKLVSLPRNQVLNLLKQAGSLNDGT